MGERIVFVGTADGLQLEGLLVTPEGATAAVPLLWLHGLQLRFCEPEYVAMARSLAANGRPVLLANTRGQGFGVWLRGGARPVLAGSGWEMVQDCVHDIDAWLGLLAQEFPGRKVALAGHGYGGAKAVFHMAARRDPRVLALVLAASASLIREKLDPQRIGEAEAMVREGRGQDLMPQSLAKGSSKGVVSAQVLVNRHAITRELHGSASAPPALSLIEVPTLSFFGALEQSPGRDVAAFLEVMARNAVRSRHFEAVLVPDAGYFFTGHEAVVAGLIEAFLAKVERMVA
ncbi:MAG: alpha/beta hydrolase [Beijerinckiaceae bacterium]